MVEENNSSNSFNSLLEKNYGFWSSLLLAFVVAVAFFSVASRFRFFVTSSPVARARSFTPLMLPVTVKSFSVLAPPRFLMPREKMARSSIFTFLPSRSSSLIQFTMSVSVPLMAPFEKGVLWLLMCSARPSSVMVSSMTG